MKQIRIYDPALCCNTGVCGTEIDQSLVDFSGDMDWAKRQGADIERYNLGQQPLVFAENPTVRAFLEDKGQGGLPLILVDGKIALSGRYPSRDELAAWLGVAVGDQTGAVKRPSGCCGECG